MFGDSNPVVSGQQKRSYVKKLRVGVALSGGVDSTAAALLLKKHYTVTGFFMQLAQPDIEQHIARVRGVADTLGIPLHIVDLADAFERCVLNYFDSSYRRGLTPNPCVVCNAEIKFGLLLNAVVEAGMEKMATGHYARLEQSEYGFRLYKGADATKDQSYFLSRLHQSQLSRIIFPLGGYIKESLYSYVEECGFTSFRGSESQDVCFLQDRKIGEYLRQRFAFIPGAIMATDGTVLGHHTGIGNYTIGQRRGLGISAALPLYVVGIDAQLNQVIVGGEDELYTRDLFLDDLHWTAGRRPSLTQPFQVKIRSTHTGEAAELQPAANGRMHLRFSRAQRAVSPGQFGVLYRDDEVLGAGTIVR